MFDHFGLIVSGAGKALRFYESCLVLLGLGITQRHPNGAFIVAATAGCGAEFLYVGPDAPEFWSDAHEPSRSPVHICFSAPSRSAVDVFSEMRWRRAAGTTVRRGTENLGTMRHMSSIPMATTSRRRSGSHKSVFGHGAVRRCRAALMVSSASSEFRLFHAQVRTSGGDIFLLTRPLRQHR